MAVIFKDKYCVELDTLSLVTEMQLEEIFATIVSDVKSLDFLPDGRVIVAQYRKGKVKVIDYMLHEDQVEKYYKTSFPITGVAALEHRNQSVVVAGVGSKTPKMMVKKASKSSVLLLIKLQLCN